MVMKIRPTACNAIFSSKKANEKNSSRIEKKFFKQFFLQIAVVIWARRVIDLGLNTLYQIERDDRKK
jgi:hypothetical protein